MQQNNKLGYPFDYGKDVTDNDVRFSNYIAKLIQNRKFQRGTLILALIIVLNNYNSACYASDIGNSTAKVTKEVIKNPATREAAKKALSSALVATGKASKSTIKVVTSKGSIGIASVLVCATAVTGGSITMGIACGILLNHTFG